MADHEAEGSAGPMHAVAADELGVHDDGERNAAQGLAVGARVVRCGRTGAEQFEGRHG